MGMLKEFQDFAMKGNVVDMAVGIVIGTAFGALVKAFVEKIVMPCVGLLGDVDFSKYDYELKAAVMKDGEVVTEAVNLGVGTFATMVLNFIIVAFAIFIVIKMMNKAKAKFEKAEEEKPAEPAADIVLLTEIRDSFEEELDPSFG